MDPIQALLKTSQLKSNIFPVSSRYHHVETSILEKDDKEPIVYLKRRFIPPPEHYQSNLKHKVQQGERLDNITANYLVDPEQFWQLADANLAMKPQELTEEIGRILRIPQGQGISGF